MADSITNWLSFFSPFIPGYLKATVLVLSISAGGVLLSWITGLLLALGRLSHNKLIYKFCRLYIWFFRGTPALTQVFLIYFGLPQLGFKLSPYFAGVIALGLNGAAYVAEILRGGLQAVPEPSLRSARALGLSPWHILRRIQLPLALRSALPGLIGEAITTIKNTSLLSTITVIDITLFSQMATALTFRPFDFYFASAVIYVAIITITTKMGDVLEKKLTKA